jgi:hypothetical protein
MSTFAEKRARAAAIELTDIKEELETLLARARKAIAGAPDADYDECTWLAHIRIALDGEHGYLARAEHTLQDAIEELEQYRDEEAPAGRPEFDVGSMLDDPFEEAT